MFLRLFTTPLSPLSYDLLALGIVAFFVWRGSRRGLVKESSAMLSLLCSYLLAKPLGTLLLLLLPLEQLPSFLRILTAATIAGLTVYLVLRLTFFAIARKYQLDREWQGKQKSIIQIGGASVGGIFGVLVILILGWYILSVGHISQVILRSPALQAGSGSSRTGLGGAVLLLPTRMTAAHWKGFSETSIGHLAANTNPVPEKVVTGIEVLTEVTEDPAKMRRLMEFEPVKNLVEEPSIQELAGDEEIRALAEQGDIAGILHHPALKQLAEDPAVMEKIRAIDMEALRAFVESSTGAAGDR